MVRIVVYCTKWVVALITALVLASCNPSFFNGVKGNGNVTTEKRSIKEAFTGIEAATGLDVAIAQGDSIKVEVEADSNLQQYIITEVEGTTLKIYINHNVTNADALKVYVTLPELTKVESTSGSNVHFTSQIKGKQLKVEASSGSHLEGNVSYDMVDAQTTSGSSMEIKGVALQLTTSSSSGSTLEARDLVANLVKADASSGSSITVHASVELKAAASSGASVSYKGKPKTVSKEETSGGGVNVL